MEDKHVRRLQVLGGHVAGPSSQQVAKPTHSHSRHSMCDKCLSDSIIEASDVGASTSYASPTSQPSSYARIHGSVAKDPVQWQLLPSIQRETLQEVKYEKATNEGIVKVCFCFGRGGGAWQLLHLRRDINLITLIDSFFL